MPMSAERRAGLVIAYFLARENERAYQALGLGNQRMTHAFIGEKLGVPLNTVKNWRDEFDAVVGSSRKGWHQREPSASRLQVVEQFGQVSFISLHGYARRLLGLTYADIEIDLSVDALSLMDSTDDALATEPSARGMTGAAAERHFVEAFEKGMLPFSGALEDKRLSGEGFDYLLTTEGIDHYFEIKGLAAASGSVLMTGKEWLTARHYKERYHLVLVSNLAASPTIQVVSDPTRVLRSRPRLVAAIQENRTISSSEIFRAAR
jgi:hypothetical protein